MKLNLFLSHYFLPQSCLKQVETYLAPSVSSHTSSLLPPRCMPHHTHTADHVVLPRNFIVCTCAVQYSSHY